jgi:hypothetical protein
VRDIGLEDMSASARALLDAREGEEGGRVGRRRHDDSLMKVTFGDSRGAITQKSVRISGNTR